MTNTKRRALLAVSSRAGLRCREAPDLKATDPVASADVNVFGAVVSKHSASVITLAAAE